MDRPNQLIDEYTLAAFIAGTLPKEKRDEVVAYLAENAEAREVMAMAYKALESAQRADQIFGLNPVAKAADDREPTRTTDRQTGRRRVRWQGAGRYVAATVVIFAVGIVLRLAFGPPTDALRSTSNRGSGSLNVEVSPTSLQFQWDDVADAYHYRVVIWDPEEARVVQQYQTADHVLTEDDAVIDDLSARLQPGATYSIRVDAIDAQNRLIRSSESVAFTYK